VQGVRHDQVDLSAQFVFQQEQGREIPAGVRLLEIDQNVDVTILAQLVAGR